MKIIDDIVEFDYSFTKGFLLTGLSKKTEDIEKYQLGRRKLNGRFEMSFKYLTIQKLE